MADLPSANELEDWLHELPTGYVDDVTREFDPGETPLFELRTGDVRVLVEARPEGSPALKLIATAPIGDRYDVEGLPEFELALWQAVASTPGYSRRVDADHWLAVNGAPSVALVYPVYDGAVTKHRVLSTLLQLADTAQAAQLFAGVVGSVESHDPYGSDVDVDG